MSLLRICCAAGLPMALAFKRSLRLGARRVSSLTTWSPILEALGGMREANGPANPVRQGSE